MNIACLGWGSLIWDPRSLGISRTENREDAWAEDGPELPVEYARESGRGRLTLVLLPSVAAVPTLWTKFTSQSLAVAQENLAAREEIEPHHREEWIAHWLRGEGSISPTQAIVESWARDRDIDAIVWTDLPPKTAGQNGIAPSLQQALSFLKSRTGEEWKAAEEYVRKTPRQIRTNFRSVFEKELGWVPTGRKKVSRKRTRNTRSARVIWRKLLKGNNFS